jgi:hypothetical protein
MTLLERLKPEHAATMAANKQEYPKLFAAVVESLDKHTSILNLTLQEIWDLTSMLNRSLSEDNFITILINSFISNNDKLVLDLSQVDGVNFEDIDHNDAPDYVDSYIFEATYFGRPMTEYELELLNEDADFKYSQLDRFLH